MTPAVLTIVLASARLEEAFTLGGTAFKGELRIESGQVRAGENAFPLARLFYAGLGKGPRRRGSFEGVALAGGELLEGRVLEMREGKVRLKTRVLGELTLPSAEVRAAVFSGAVPRGRASEDEVHLANGDLLRGKVEYVSDSKLAIRTKFGLSTVKREVVNAVVLSTAAAGERSGFCVGLKGGERLSGEIASLDGSALVVRTPYAGEVRVPRAHVASIRTLSRSVEWLSDREPAERKEHGEFDAVFPFTRDIAMLGGALSVGGWSFQKGLCCHSYCALVYELNGAYAAFVAFAGLDDELAKGSVTMRVETGGERAWKRSFTGPGRELVFVDLKGRKRLRLVVDFGPDGHDACDHADWALAALVRK